MEIRGTRSTPARKAARTVAGTALLLAAMSGARAHHTYAMFDGSKSPTVNGTVAKVEWNNPHVFIWIYVPRAETPGQYDLYAFESDSIGALTMLGWSNASLQPGNKVTIEYHPLRDGRMGGHVTTVILPDGHALRTIGGAIIGGARPPPGSAAPPK
jgi:hypothetical protein